MSSNLFNLPTVANYAAFRSLGFAASQYTTVYILGAVSANDGGEGVFTWNAASTATDDSGITLQATGVTTGRGVREFSGPVNVAWFGASPSSSATVNASAIQAASNTGLSVYFPASGIYSFNATLRFKADGQVWQGQGGGHVNTPFVATTLKYTGAGGSPAVSLYDGSAVRQACTFMDMDIDANNLATYALEGYVDSYTAGAWFNRVIRAVLTNGTSGACYLGLGAAPAFANDYYFDGVVFCNTLTGIIGAGSLYSFSNNCLVFNCSTVGINASTGAWSIGNTIFSHNNTDITIGNGGRVSGTDGWMEDSATGAVICTGGAAHLSLKGYKNMSTNSTSKLIDLNNAAGDFEVTGCTGVVVGGSTSILIININPSAQRNFLGSFLSPQDNIIAWSPHDFAGAGGFHAYNQASLPSGGQTGAGYLIGSTVNMGVFWGSGPPTLSAAQGSLYLRSDGTTVNDRMYVNTNGTTGWTAVTTAS